MLDRTDSEIVLTLVEDRIDFLTRRQGFAYDGPVDRGPQLARLRRIRRRIRAHIGVFDTIRDMVRTWAGGRQNVHDEVEVTADADAAGSGS